jgi:Fur family peroxide stress response transcriptional regulator
MAMTRQVMVEKLRDKGLKITPQRLAIIDVLVEKQPLHPSAAQIYSEGRKKNRGLSLSTVYATLGELSRHGLIKTLEFDQMENRYEMNLEDHVNLICERCGTIIDYHAPVTVNHRELTAATGFRVLNARMEYYGYCRDCLEHRTGDAAARPAATGRRGGRG